MALDNEKTRLTMKGLKGVYVVVEDLDLKIEGEGLGREQLQKGAELELGKAGIRILSEEEWRNEEGEPWLYIYVHVVKKLLQKKAVYIFHISIELKQKVRLLRESGGEVFATTWSKAVLGKSGELKDVEKGLKAMLTFFIEAFNSVNQ
jgi:hypothetical protein